MGTHLNRGMGTHLYYRESLWGKRNVPQLAENSDKPKKPRNIHGFFYSKYSSKVRPDSYTFPANSVPKNLICQGSYI